MHEVLVNRLGGLSLPRKSVVRLTDRPDMTLDVYRGRKTKLQQQQQFSVNHASLAITKAKRISKRLKTNIVFSELAEVALCVMTQVGDII